MNLQEDLIFITLHQNFLHVKPRKKILMRISFLENLWDLGNSSLVTHTDMTAF